MSSLYRVPHILTFEVAAKCTTNKLQTKEDLMLENQFHKQHFNKQCQTNIGKKTSKCKATPGSLTFAI